MYILFSSNESFTNYHFHLFKIKIKATAYSTVAQPHSMTFTACLWLAL